jgi:hypothetical protein
MTFTTPRCSGLGSYTTRRDTTDVRNPPPPAAVDGDVAGACASKGEQNRVGSIPAVTKTIA